VADVVNSGGARRRFRSEINASVKTRTRQNRRIAVTLSNANDVKSSLARNDRTTRTISKTNAAVRLFWSFVAGLDDETRGRDYHRENLYSANSGRQNGTFSYRVFMGQRSAERALLSSASPKFRERSSMDV